MSDNGHEVKPERGRMQLVSGTPPVVAVTIGGFGIWFRNAEAIQAFIDTLKEGLVEMRAGCPHCGSDDVSYSFCFLTEPEYRPTLEAMMGGLK
jgi:hypothetical protein